MLQIVVFLIAHWVLSIFCQTFFLHRYGAHSMFSMSWRWERVFHLLTFLCQGSSYLNPRAYAYLHREHHAYSDTERDPHSPYIYPNLITLMLVTKKRYDDFNKRGVLPEARLQNPPPPGLAIDRQFRSKSALQYSLWDLVHAFLFSLRSPLGVLPPAPRSLRDRPNPRCYSQLVWSQIRLPQLRNHPG